MNLCYDAGHGGRNHGCRSMSRLTREEDLTLAVGLRLLQIAPDTVLTRSDDYTLSFDDRRRIAKDAESDLVISGHFDSIPSAPSKRGLHAYYPKDNRAMRDLATWAVVNAPQDLRGGSAICAYDDPGRSSDDWKDRAQTVVESFSPPMDCLLLEFGYLSNPGNMRYCRSTYGIDDMARHVLAISVNYQEIKQ